MFSGCTRALDIHFALDASANVGQEKFEVMKNFVQAVGYKFIISETGSHMSASVFGDEAGLMFTMASATQQEDFLTKVDEIQYVGGLTGRMDKALNMVSNEVFTLDGFARQSVPKVLVMLTASNCDFCNEKLEKAVQPLKEQGVHVVVIPIGNNVKMDEINAMASLPPQEYVLPKASYEELLNGVFIQKVSSIICSGKPGVCKEPPIPEDCPEVVNECITDINCPSNRKCCFKDCKASCEPPIAGKIFLQKQPFTGVL